jgi:hypothetical protein
MDVAGGSDGDDAFWGDESSAFEQMALIQHRVNGLFSFEPKTNKSRPFDICCTKEVT